MPVQFLEQLFSTLRRDGLLHSQRGVKGGYTLARPPEEITVLEVVQALDGKVGQEADEAGGIWARRRPGAARRLQLDHDRRHRPPRGRPRPAPACTTSDGRKIEPAHASVSSHTLAAGIGVDHLFEACNVHLRTESRAVSRP